MNKTLMDKARSIPSDVGLSQDYWEKVVDIACHVVNRSSTSNLVDQTPNEDWDGKTTSHSCL